MPGCYYRRVDNRPHDTAPDEPGETTTEATDWSLFDSTALTRSNWAEDLQHGSPPLALLTRAIEELVAPGQRIARLSLDILGAIPVTRLAACARVRRPGRRITLLDAELRDVGAERTVARLGAWALTASDTHDVATDRYPPLVEGAEYAPPSWFAESTGYARSVHWRNQRDPGVNPGADPIDGPAAAAESWISPTVHLVDAEETTALQRLAMVVDSANGVGAVLDTRDFMFMNTDTVVHLHRPPSGSDFGLRARASIGPDGIGVTTAELFDRSGFIGTSAQTLLIQRR